MEPATRTATYGTYLLLILGLSVGCSRCEEVPGYTGCLNPPTDDVLRAAWSVDPQGLDPTRYFDDISWRAARMLFEGLTRLAPDGTVVSGVAETWEADPTATRYTFHLREDALWSDGRAITADDFVFAWRRLLDPSLGAEAASELYVLAGARAVNRGEAEGTTLGVRAEGERTLVAELAEPDPDFDERVALPPFFPLPAHLVTADYLNWPAGESPVGNGPFVLRQWRPRDRLVADRSPTYWNRGAVGLAGVVLYPISDPTTAMNLYRAGRLDWIRAGAAPPDILQQMITEDSPEILISTSHQIYFLELNTRRFPTDDPRVRRALELTLPRAEIAESIMGGGQVPTRVFVNPIIPGWRSAHVPEGDAETARRLLAEAGYPNGEGLPELEYVYGDRPIHGEVAAFVQGYWQRTLGIRVHLTMMDFAAKEERVANGRFHISRGGWLADRPDPWDYLKIFRSGDENNLTGWSDSGYDDLLARASASLDRGERFRLLAEAEDVLLDAAPVLPVLFQSAAQLVRPYFVGLVPSPIDVVDWTAVRIDPNWRP